MQKTVVRQGYMKFWRLGSIEFGNQSRWSRAPKTKGLWAFPYPFYDTFLTNHKYRDLLPKRLLTETTTYEEQQEWVNNVGRKILPLREFWYKGDLFTHFEQNGYIGDPGIIDPQATHWSVMDATQLNKHIISSGANKTFYPTPHGLQPIGTSVDHLEVFIAPNMGTIQEGKTLPKNKNNNRKEKFFYNQEI